MARGKFNKRGGGPRLDAENEEEIEIRNNRLAELEEQRQARREGEDDSDEEGEDKDDKKDKKGGDTKDDAKKTETIASDPKKKPAAATVDAGSDAAPAAPVTTEADHARNMKRLAEIRKRREEAEARRKMEEESEQQLEEERKQLAALATGGGGGFDDVDDDKKKKSSSSKSIPKLDKIAIKKLKPAQMKEALKERGLDYQGNAKALTDRLIKYESER
jgi:hypothetical protein